MDSESIQGLLRADAFPHPVHELRLIETHISWVLLTGDTVYKIKKPLNFGFLDFSTLVKRHHFCNEELRLNRRFAAELYLDVVPITEQQGQLCIGGDGEPVEFAVRMRQFDQVALLDRQLEEGRFGPADAAALGRVIADLHATLPSSRPGQTGAPGSPESLHAAVVQNFDQIQPYLVHDEGAQEQLRHVADWSATRFREIAELLRERGREGLVRECHGDLHLGNIARIGDRFLPFDCIEFNDDFRIFDLQGESGFLCMDLQRRGCDVEANRFYNAYLEESGDYAGVALGRFYRCYFAVVRAKVSLLAHQGPPPADHPVWETYRRYLHLAARYTEPAAPVLVLMHGVSGSGKSTVAQQLADTLGAITIRADVERKRLHGLAVTDASDSDLNLGIYSAESTVRTYARLEEISEILLASGDNCIVDATFLDQARRERFFNLGDRLGCQVLLVNCFAPEDVLKRRVAERYLGPAQASEAGRDVLQMQMRRRQELSDTERLRAIDVDSSSASWQRELAAALTAGNLRR